MTYDPIFVVVSKSGARDFLTDLPRVMQLHKILIITWDNSIDTNLAYDPTGAIICSGDMGSVLRVAERQHFDMIAYTWPDLFLALKDPRGSVS